MTCDLVVVAPHPDDAEIHAGAIIASQVRQGLRVAVIDCTAGELGSRGTAHTRAQEAANASQVLGLCARENLGLPDGALQADALDQRAALVSTLRRLRPRVVLAMHGHAAHPDHRAVAELTLGAVKACALHRYLPEQPALPSLRCLAYEAELPLGRPDLVMACTEEDWQCKRRAITCYGSQLHQGQHDQGPTTTIADPGFLPWIEARGRVWGRQIGAAYGEALLAPLAPWAISQL